MERHDRALRAANADRNEMQTSLSAMQEERQGLTLVPNSAQLELFCPPCNPT